MTLQKWKANVQSERDMEIKTKNHKTLTLLKWYKPKY
jgi:hypothetical protein